VSAVPGGLDDGARRFVSAFKERHTLDEVLAGLVAVRQLKALVVGEAIVDEYSYCAPVGKTPREAVVVTRHLRSEAHAGGALACANHVAGFCADVQLVTCLGDVGDTREAFARERLRPNVTPCFFVRPGAPTITKRRYVREHPLARMFEVDTFDDTPWPPALEDRVLEHLERTLVTRDVVIVADYGHGFLGERVVSLLAERARFLAVNTQANAANLGFHVVTRYPRAGYVSIDEPELRLATGDRWGPLGDLADRVRSRLGCAVISVTRGADGVLVSGPDGVRWEIPVFSRDVVDRMGAGDAHLSVTALCAAARMPADVIGLIGMAVGALAVRVVGNRTAVEPGALRRFVTDLVS